MRNEYAHSSGLVFHCRRSIRRQLTERWHDLAARLALLEMEVEAIVARGYGRAGRNKQHSQAPPPPVTFHPGYAVKDGSYIECRGRHDIKEMYVAGMFREYCTRCDFSQGVGCLSS